MKNLWKIFGPLQLYPPVWTIGGYQWMRGRYWESIKKGIEISLGDDGELELRLFEIYEVAPENQKLLGKTDDRTIWDYYIPTPFKKSRNAS